MKFDIIMLILFGELLSENPRAINETKMKKILEKIWKVEKFFLVQRNNNEMKEKKSSSFLSIFFVIQNSNWFLISSNLLRYFQTE